MRMNLCVLLLLVGVAAPKSASATFTGTLKTISDDLKVNHFQLHMK